MVTILLTGACLFGASRLENSFRHTLVCGPGVTPITQRAAVDVGAYEVANLALARSLPLPTTKAVQITHEPYRRCEDARLDSDVVGVRSTFVVALPVQSDRCTFMTSLESDLAGSGWSVHAPATSEVDERGYVPLMTAERSHQLFDLSIDGSGTYLGVVADYDAPGDQELTKGMPSTACA